ncbi:hypothetical protein AYR62_14125 [Secundilactobacillus paracollinoides]|uniref:ABC transporter domain-containing protein n=1 Tax=Secundilactobacillus paracollinoides TaxID=240427 RepID=A0A1B2IWZ5_9LACO|nr:ATP-binding cassette domain-containing protein [Secundilactobacillus paracollinoides]ANZ60731.1 hypothetical protein AYR61_04830 [Secundilactobacillus paracollinoides]ANZ65103.1 hypothetical protein AYR62_14125 [Secundilactobacillus paracollinoides]ANZ66575.1 hypothetical protein AYR63_05120 [Secundilactobacillus paracollinoides]
MEAALLQISGLTKTYNKRTILDNINMSVQEGTIVGLVGPNGVGKTTLMKCILELTPFSQGEIVVNGQTITARKKPKITEIGALIESPGLYTYLSGMDNIRLYTNDVDEALLERVITIFKMDHYIQKKVSGYSLGMRQKVGILQAIITGKRVVILDEPINGLDPQSVVDFRTIIQDLAATGVTFLISSHLISELERLADNLYILNNGGHLEAFDIRGGDANHWFELATTNNNKLLTELTRATISSHQANGRVVVNLATEATTKTVFNIIAANHIEVTEIRQTDDDLEMQILDQMKRGK